jgi:hypothetical protein
VVRATRRANSDTRTGERYGLAAVGSLVRGPTFLFRHAALEFGQIDCASSLPYS